MYSSNATQYFCRGRGWGLILLKVDLFICVSLFSRVSVCNLTRMLNVQHINFIVNALLNHIALKKSALHNMLLCLTFGI